jgi:GAF domain-containing protein
MRRRREQQQIALTTIADQTKIKLSLLEALERDDVSRWPTGIFRRAFIRAYAHAIGLEPDVIVREFLEAYPDPVEVVATVPAMIAAATPGNDMPPTRLHYLVGNAIDSLARLRRKRPTVEDEPLPAESTSAEPMSAAPVAGEPLPAKAVAAPAPPPPLDPDLSAVAALCTQISRAEETRDAAPVLQEIARLIDALGIIVWTWDPQAAELTAALAHGYSDNVLAQLPRVRRDADNATAAAFRSAQTCVVNGSELTSGALVVPLLTPGGCAGVLAIELQHTSTQKASVRALVTIFAAQLARLVGAARPVEAADRRLA